MLVDVHTSPPSGSRTVLVVDDDQVLLDVIRFELLRAGPPPVLVLLDLMMPVMSGWASLEELATQPALQEIPVLVLAASEPDDVPGAVGILRKPFDLDVLIEAVERHARGGE